MDSCKIIVGEVVMRHFKNQKYNSWIAPAGVSAGAVSHLLYLEDLF